MKKVIVFFFTGLLSSIHVLAQETPATKKFWEDPINHPMTPLYFVLAFVLAVVILVIIASIYLIRSLNLMTFQAEQERAKKLGIAYRLRRSWWDKFLEQINASAPVEQEKDIDLGHSYDGIRELDNHLPPWWKWLFYATIGWSVIYLVVYHVTGSLPLSEQEYKNQVAEAAEQIQKFKASQPKAEIDESTLQYSTDAAIIENGKSVFISNNCGSCHRNDGGGNTIGPNLTDMYWIHGGDIKSIFRTIKNGAVEKGMPAWGKSMSPKDVRDLAFFVMSLQGTNPPNAKVPQGELFRDTQTAASDSTKAQASL